MKTIKQQQQQRQLHHQQQQHDFCLFPVMMRKLLFIAVYGK
jgi:TPP-dependent 2-oxoacid decarboxylase